MDAIVGESKFVKYYIYYNHVTASFNLEPTLKMFHCINKQRWWSRSMSEETNLSACMVEVYEVNFSVCKFGMTPPKRIMFFHYTHKIIKQKK